MKIRNKARGFTQIELLVVMTIIAIASILAFSVFWGHAEQSKMTHIKHDIKVLENAIDNVFLHTEDFPSYWIDMSDLKLKHLAQQGKLYSTNGLVEDIHLDHFRVIDRTDVRIRMKSYLRGTFYIDRRGNVYYEESLRAEDINEDIDIEQVLSSVNWVATPSEYFTFDPDTGTIIEFHPTGAGQDLPRLRDVVVPRFIGDVRVERIGPLSFRSTSLYSLIMPDTILHIDGEAFRNNSLVTVIITGNITYIGDNAFRNNHLEEIELGDSLTHIGADAFRNNALRQVIIPANAISIGDNAFRNNALTRVVIPSEVAHIGPDAFRDNGLIDITIGANVAIDDAPNTMGANRNFRTAYLANDRQAGTYIYENRAWSFLH